MPVALVPVMKIAMPIWQDRISPVFDAATRLLLADAGDGVIRNRSEAALTTENPVGRTQELRGRGVEVLICGAISRPLESLLRAAGIEVVPQVCGTVEEILEAYLRGGIGDDRYRMPGCCRRRQFRRRGHCRGREDTR